MGGVISVVQIVLTTGLVGIGIAEAVLKAKLKELIQPHEEEFILMDQLYKFVDVLLNQKNLVSQLNANVLFATDNWNTIFYDLEDKNDQLKKIFDRFPNIKSTNFNYTFTNGMMFAISIVALGYMGYNFVSGKVKTQILADVAAFKEFFKTSAAKIRSLAPVIKSGSMNAEGVIEVNSHGTNNETVPPETRASKTENVKSQEKSGIKSKVTMGLRVIFIAVAIYGFVQGVKGLIHLTQQIEMYENYFSDEGQFEKSKDGVIELMNCVAADIFNLGNASRAGFYDSRITLLIMSITFPRFQDTLIAFSKRLDNEKFGMGDDFIDESKGLIDSCNTVVKSTKPSKEKLKELEHYFRNFFDAKKPEKVFLDVSIELSKVTGEYSVISTGVQADQGRSKRLLENVSEYFLDYRDQDFPDKTLARKKQLDTKIMTKTFDKFKAIYELDPALLIQNADAYIKDIIFQVIISFADDFYFDDDSGKTLFGKIILDSKLDVNYKDMLEKELSKANVIPVRKSKDADEQKEIDYWLNIAKEKNKQVKYWDTALNPKSRYRYIRLEVEKYTNSEGKELGRLLSFEGIHLSVSQYGILNPDLYNAERNVMTGLVTLIKASQ